MESMKTINQMRCCTNASVDSPEKPRVLDSCGPRDAGREVEKGSQMHGIICEGNCQGLRTADFLRALARDGAGRLVGGLPPSPVDDATEEQRLIARCMLGEEEAWATVFQLYHPRLIHYIEYLTRVGDREQAEEVAAAVWCSLCGGMASVLKRYDPKAGGLLRCLKYLARGVLLRRRRTERRERIRECKAARSEAMRGDVGYGIMVQEFLATLTRREREFCLSILLSVAEVDRSRAISGSNEYTLRSRIMKKLRIYMVQNN